MGTATRYRAAFNDPDAVRHSVPTFPWNSAPEGLATRRQLRTQGLRPGGQDIAGQILWRGVGGVRAAYLYRVALALPKRTATPAQLDAIAKALRARRTCSTCHTVRSYYIPGRYGECLTCAGKEQ
ncbi:hypothetical protein Lfu02_21370 [Longispora fulva]|uniref:Mono/diheme cytochrome c family protein n=1 Tax=Longispora fulva TaxID=619741 RepID=A0A8J7GUN6_9ACTN|nr:RRQRL motif-containing zinc-binding protein [Longispora fulva]MBG6139850.1 mono/diheme cytochrome c family protein [Longispora fulva]GIG57765.1 hypothetical protein Lfu02_21370 [Longispora fulva]